ncbi:ATP-binding protein [Desulfonatronum thioautotrophicum]|uniref:ATP-binding protein n=1 Tax=Desulfonatronum thioautotrophicum TaxID=617001 RepID=UPI00069C95A4|nr:ATP-binding protein [Desulfonatronum thioautotrophicum]
MSSSVAIPPETGQFRILDHIPLGVVVLDAGYHVVFWNKCLEYWTGQDAAGISGQDIRKHFPLVAEKRFATRIASVFRGGPPIIFSSHIHKYLIPATLPNGSYRLQHVTVSPMRRRDGSFLAMIMLQDVTEVNTRLIQRKQAEDRLRNVLSQLEATNAQLEKSNAQAVRMARKAQEANAAKSIFLANMSHEIRTPMGGILGALDMLASKEQDADKLTLLRMTTDSAKSLLQIINDILDLSKVEAGKMELHPEDVSLETIMRRCRDLYSIPARNKNLDLHLDLGPGLPRTLRIDPTRLEQILRNLLDNAIKFTHQGWVRFGVQYVQGADLGPALHFAVQDSGIGISASSLDQLFRPFSQADSSYAKQHGGTGLGLALSRRLAELMDGTLVVKSTPGQGSIFSLVLPLSQSGSTEFGRSSGSSAQPPEPDPSRPDPKITLQPLPSQQPGPLAKQRTIRVLVAEDVELNQQYLTFLLERHGYHLDLVTNGLAAVQAFASATYDIILMDIQMPDMDGLEATERIRALERERNLPRTPIIALTAYAMPEEQANFLARDMDGFLPKPIQGAHLHAEMQRLLKISPQPISSEPEIALESVSETASEATSRNDIIADPGPIPVFNLRDIQSRFMGNDALWRKMVAHFLQQELPEYREQLNKLLQDADPRETARLAHKIKGALGTLCAEPSHHAAAVLEKIAKNADVSATATGMYTLLAELDRMPSAFAANQADRDEEHQRATPE